MTDTELPELPEHVAANRAYWDEQAPEYVANGEVSWARDEPKWGIWGIPEGDVHVLPDDLAGKDAIELGWARPTCPPGSRGGARG